MSKLAILSDIHGNIEALEAVLEDLESLKHDRIVVLGDTVGYGPNPRECWQKVWQIADLILIGNHEKEAVIPDRYGMCGDAKVFLDWSIEQIKDDSAEFRRIGYNFRKTQKKMLQLPLDEEYKEFFAQRLAKGE